MELLLPLGYLLIIFLILALADYHEDFDTYGNIEYRRKQSAARHKLNATYESTSFRGRRKLRITDLSLESGGRSYPNFFVLGERKCATTSMNDLFLQHKDFCETIKEPHFFDNNFNSEGRSRYIKTYNNCGSKLVVDGTPAYARFKHAAHNMLEYYGEKLLRSKKFILIFREPLAAQFSWFEHRLRECSKHMRHVHQNLVEKHPKHKHYELRQEQGFCDHPMCSAVGCDDVTLQKNETIEHTKHLRSFREYVRSYSFDRSDGNYLEHLRVWSDTVGRENLMVLGFETVIKNTTDVSKRIARFLNLTSDWGDNVVYPHDNDSGHLNALADCETWDRLQKYYDDANFGLVDEINKHPKKPPLEPVFLPFTKKRKCSDTKTN